MSAPPLPPEVLIRRVGWNLFSADPADVYEERGREQWRLVKSLLPSDFALDGRRVLDFGAGAGRVLRHALVEDPGAELWGCDVDARSVDWMRANLPGAHVFQTGEWPPTVQPGGHFDLIIAFSVFTHLLDTWSAWLLELHRLLVDDGLAIVTVYGPGISNHGEVPVSEDTYGMNVLNPGTPWDFGGPFIVHSQWWLRGHWGRAFAIPVLRPGDKLGSPPLFGQSILVMRKRPGTFTAADLEAPVAGEPRELAAAQQNVASLRHEVELLTERHNELVRELRVTVGSRSWRLTAPLRALGRVARGPTAPPPPPES